jgi:hypothetical protein
VLCILILFRVLIFFALPCYSALLFAIMPCWKATLHRYLVDSVLLLCLSLLHLATLNVAPCCSVIAPCYFALLLYHRALCSRLTILPCCLSHLVACLSFKYLMPHPHCCFITLMLAFTPCYFTLSSGTCTPSPPSCVGGGAWSNKFHPTT